MGKRWTKGDRIHFKKIGKRLLMDPGGIGALIGISVMLFVGLSCYLKDLYDKRKPEHRALLTTQPVLIEQSRAIPVLPPLLKRQRSSMRDFFETNTNLSGLKVVRIS